MKFTFKIQQYQTDAVESTVRVFQGQPYRSGVTYLRDDADRYQQDSAADAGRYLGRALSGDRPRLWVYAVKDDPDRNVLYVRDGYDGAFYVREGWGPSDSRR